MQAHINISTYTHKYTNTHTHTEMQKHLWVFCQAFLKVYRLLWENVLATPIGWTRVCSHMDDFQPRPCSTLLAQVMCPEFPIPHFDFTYDWKTEASIFGTFFFKLEVMSNEWSTSSWLLELSLIDFIFGSYSPVHSEWHASFYVDASFKTLSTHIPFLILDSGVLNIKIYIIYINFI